MRPDQLQKGKTPVELGVPITGISMDLTEGCNLRCEYCFCDLKAPKSNNDLSLETGKEIIDWLADKNTSGDTKIIRLEWWGGEPYTKFDMMKELTKYANNKAKELGKTIEYNTTCNIAAINEEKLRWALDNNTIIMFSIDGREERNRLRKLPNGDNSWKIIEDKIKLITKIYKELNLKATYRMTVDPRTIVGMIKDMKWLYSLYENIDVMFSENYDIEWTENDLKLYEKELQELIDFKLEFLKKGNYIENKPIEGTIENHIYKLFGYKPKTNKYNCGAGKNYVGISIEGAIYPCHRCNKHNTIDTIWSNKDACLGSIYENITNIELHKKLTEDIVHPSLSNKSSLDQCKSCEIEDTCHGMCLAVSKDTTNHWDKTTKQACDIKKIINKYSKIFVENLISSGLFSIYNSRLKYLHILPKRELDKGFKACSCYIAKYTNPIEQIRAKAIGGPKDTDIDKNDTLKLLIMARDIIDEQIVRHTDIDMEFKKESCMVYMRHGVTRNLISNVSDKDKYKLIQQLPKMVKQCQTNQ